MTASELKLYLLEKIIETTDIDLLLRIKSLLEENNYAVSEESLAEVNEPALKYEKNIRIFTPEEQRKIDQALREYENGECISDEEAQREIQAWLED
ncbi:hypothetical protein [Flavobacterium sp. LC2016-12]|uniref:hypothetical protein n=1 Tax=Flavobacterium sp. LC2016-12 TaxID=2783794 RepID=UPI00188D1D67|nr:hypothetical protein [Flavobacterium sp. LC2016-12]MBF4465470.1 hypothetical protein [Flavobacterium sp. LC2016-12]